MCLTKKSRTKWTCHRTKTHWSLLNWQDDSEKESDTYAPSFLCLSVSLHQLNRHPCVSQQSTVVHPILWSNALRTMKEKRLMRKLPKLNFHSHGWISRWIFVLAIRLDVHEWRRSRALLDELSDRRGTYIYDMSRWPLYHPQEQMQSFGFFKAHESNDYVSECKDS